MNQLPSQRTIPWNDLLFLLEGQTVHLPTPKTHLSKDIAVKSDTPIFRTAMLDQQETDMMKVWWNLFQLSCLMVCYI